jgi:hypothetical protein
MVICEMEIMGLACVVGPNVVAIHGNARPLTDRDEPCNGGTKMRLK